MRTDSLLAALRAHVAYDADESRHVIDTIAFVMRRAQTADASWWRRSTLEGHITSSAWLIDAAGEHALLLHHAKLGRWLQPGGHLDATDATPSAGALREAIEECGIASLTLASTALFDVDVHAIPARGAEPAHLHYDLRYLIISAERSVNVSSESLGATWMPVTELTRPEFERSISRMAEKTQRLDRT